jgi:D-tyrosyl-tRNA(Tyr) deacylase
LVKPLNQRMFLIISGDAVRVLIQRVTRAEVRVDNSLVGSIQEGLCMFVGVTHSDTPQDATRLAERASNLRILQDADGKMNRSLRDSGGSALVISQFTLYADTRRGRRPSFVDAAAPDDARLLIATFVETLQAVPITVEEGIFGADMAVSLTNDGPVTILLEQSSSTAELGC